MAMGVGMGLGGAVRCRVSCGASPVEGAGDGKQAPRRAYRVSGWVGRNGLNRGLAGPVYPDAWVDDVEMRLKPGGLTAWQVHDMEMRERVAEFERRIVQRERGERALLERAWSGEGEGDLSGGDVGSEAVESGKEGMRRVVGEVTAEDDLRGESDRALSRAMDPVRLKYNVRQAQLVEMKAMRARLGRDLAAKERTWRLEKAQSGVTSAWHVDRPGEAEVETQSREAWAARERAKLEMALAQAAGHAEAMPPLAPLLAQDFEVATGAGGLAVVLFSSPWCGPCKEMMPLIQTLAVQRQGQAAFYSLVCSSEDENPGHRALVRRLGIRRVPTLVIYRDGALVYTASGNKAEVGRLGLEILLNSPTLNA